MNPAENYILNQREPFKSILFQLQGIIEATIPKVDLKYKWHIPYYYLNKRPLCYLNQSKDYIDLGFRFGDAIVPYENHLVKGQRKLFRSLRYFKPEDVDIDILAAILIELRKSTSY